MKKLLLTTSVLALTLSASAQLSGTDGYTMDNKLASSNCLINAGLPNNGGIMNGDQNTFVASTSKLTADGLTLISLASVPTASITPSWYALPAIDGESCSTLNGAAKGIDLTSKSKVTIKATSSEANATLSFYLGGEGQWGPASSTYNTGSGKGIVASHTFTSTNEETFTFDFATLDQAIWSGWAGKNKIQSVGFSSASNNATFNISQVLIGSKAESSTSVSNVSAVSFSVFPNPASDLINVTLADASNSTLELSDLAGNVVSSQSVSGATTIAVNTSNLSSGVYLVSVRSENGVSTQKVVIK